MSPEHAYGCIPFNRSRSREPQALMILRTRGFWEFPKGKIEAGETAEECALRELREETGLSGELQAETPLTTSYHFEREGTVFEKHVSFFFCRVPDGAQARVDGREVADSAWLPLEQLADRATYPEMKECARKAALVLAD